MRNTIGRVARIGLLAAGMALAAGGALATGTEDATTATPRERIELLMAQVLGTVCETPDAECEVDEAPVGSICQCGETPGEVVAE
ncbi:MAG: hypothetical protein JNK88_05345 [Mangrovicoccus sp.]|nr:hypothetical protein [Mangrovicoccus sp.]